MLLNTPECLDSGGSTTSCGRSSPWKNFGQLGIVICQGDVCCIGCHEFSEDVIVQGVGEYFADYVCWAQIGIVLGGLGHLAEEGLAGGRKEWLQPGS